MQYPQLAVWMWIVIVCEQHNTLKSQLLLPTVHTDKHVFFDKRQCMINGALKR